ncbi:MAG: histidine phosphatase family protein [Desulfobacterales bacterium]|nr:histidine phosphatase family protein [Desulfobacterales bacterium]MDJ0855069.1 histidine phosphatase family protein [Desulfobacterales bacterium]MDJ0885994.1 histidine phosphatase family protein [Desulfobacterales bacterium]MDJ0989142.1 histidine phosphatase family protein [Desulfobacterales bacterium]
MNIPETTLMLIRHGETEWNRDRRFQGHGDSPLTAKGRAQTDALGRRLAATPFDRLISSDLGRTQETAAIIAGHTGHAIQTDPRLRERHYGVLEGLNIREIRRDHAAVYAQLITEDPDFVIPGGQSHRQHYRAGIDFLEEWLNARSGQSAAIVSHGGFLDNVLRYVAGLALGAPRCVLAGNSSLSIVVHGQFYGSPRWIIRSWGDEGHLVGMAP